MTTTIFEYIALGVCVVILFKFTYDLSQRGLSYLSRVYGNFKDKRDLIDKAEDRQLKIGDKIHCRDLADAAAVVRELEKEYSWRCERDPRRDEYIIVVMGRKEDE